VLWKKKDRTQYPVYWINKQFIVEKLYKTPEKKNFIETIIKFNT
jgi:hypothetical protein